MPAETDDADNLLGTILEAADKNGTDVCFISEDVEIDFADMAFFITAPIGIDSDNERGLIINASFG